LFGRALGILGVWSLYYLPCGLCSELRNGLFSNLLYREL